MTTRSGAGPAVSGASHSARSATLSGGTDVHPGPSSERPIPPQPSASLLRSVLPTSLTGPELAPQTYPSSCRPRAARAARWASNRSTRCLRSSPPPGAALPPTPSAHPTKPTVKHIPSADTSSLPRLKTPKCDETLFLSSSPLFQAPAPTTRHRAAQSAPKRSKTRAAASLFHTHAAEAHPIKHFVARWHNPPIRRKRRWTCVYDQGFGEGRRRAELPLAAPAAGAGARPVANCRNAFGFAYGGRDLFA